MKNRAFALVAGLGISLAGLSSCSEQTPEPERFVELSAAIAESAVDNEFSLMRGADIQTDGATALFSIGWREFFGRLNETAVTVGRGLAVASLNQLPLAPPFAGTGIDLGSVSIDYGSSQTSLTSHSGRFGGIFYSSFTRPRFGSLPTNIPFIPGGDYEFNATGSDQFPSFSATITAPGSLLSITSHSMNEVFSLTRDLVISWEGADDNAAILITLFATTPPPFVGPRGAAGAGHHHPSMDRNEKLQIRLDDNPGTYTVDAGSLQTLFEGNEATVLSCMVSQFRSELVPYDGGIACIVARNGDRVRLIPG